MVRRFVRQRAKHTVFVIEQPPACRTVQFVRGVMENPSSNDLKTCNKEDVIRVRLSFPYCVFLLCWNGSHIQTPFLYFNQKALASVTDLLGRPCLPNIDSKGRVCMGKQWIKSAGTIREQAAHAIQHFWSSVFGVDYYEFFAHARPNDARLSTVTNWAEATRIDPLMGLTVEWSGGARLNYLVDKVFDEYGAQSNEILAHTAVHYDVCVQDVVEKVLRKAVDCGLIPAPAPALGLSIL